MIEIGWKQICGKCDKNQKTKVIRDKVTNLIVVSVKSKFTSYLFLVDFKKLNSCLHVPIKGYL